MQICFSTDTVDMCTMFSRPHECSTVTSVDVRVNLSQIRTQDSFESFLAALDVELAAVYDGKMRRTAVDPILYSCAGNDQQVFGNIWNARAFDLLKEFDSSHAQATELRGAYEAMMAARPAPVKLEPKFDENGEEIPPPPKSKKVLREEADQKKKDTEQLRAVLAMEHREACAAIKLKNVFGLNVIRVPVSPV
jgi:hypothetical protein